MAIPLVQKLPRDGVAAVEAGRWLDELAVEVDAMRQNRAFQAALEAMARFWRYSPTNAWLILRQCPHARRVAGRRAWEQLGRKVHPDAEPIRILAPMSPRGFPFCVVDVFDISQTHGRAVPTLGLALRGETDASARLEAAARRLGIVVEELYDARWVGRSLGSTIQLRPHLSSLERTATLAHELAHELLHASSPNAKRRRSLSRVEREAQAESTAYVILRALGLPSTAPTYIAWQGGDGAAVLRALGPVQRAARTILEAATDVRAATLAPSGTVEAPRSEGT